MRMMPSFRLRGQGTKGSMASGKWQKSLQGKIHESIVHFSSRWRQAMTASFPFATPLMRHRQLGRGSRIFCGVWGNRSCVVDSGGPEPAKPCPSHDLDPGSDGLPIQHFRTPSSLAFRMPSLRSTSAACAEQSTFEPRRLAVSPHLRLSRRRCPRARCTIRRVSPVLLPNPKRSNLDTSKQTDTGAQRLTGWLL